MRKLFFSLFCIISLGAFAQITIDSAHMPQNGDTLRYSIAALDSTLLQDFQKSDTNLTWNFDSLIPVRQGITEYINPSQTPYSGSVSSGIGEKLADTLSLGGIELIDVYDFYANSKAEFATVRRAASVPTGLNFPFPPIFSIVQAYSDKDEVYQFPLDYGDRDSSTFEFTFNNTFPAAYYSTSGYRINEVDAWGTLTTPYGTFDCIRVITDIVSYDSISYDTIDFGLGSHLREYKWLTTQFEIPALTVSGTVINDSLFIPSVVQYRDSVRDVPSLLSPIALFLTDDFNPQVGDTVTINNLSLSILPANYEWDINPKTFQYVNGTSSTSDSVIVIFNDTGFYDVQLIAINSNGRDTLLIENYILVDTTATGLFEVSGINKELNNLIKTFPQPVSKEMSFYLQIPNNIVAEKASIYNIRGMLIRELDLSGHSKTMQGQQTIQMPPLTQAGIYFIVLNTSEGLISSRIISQ